MNQLKSTLSREQEIRLLVEEMWRLFDTTPLESEKILKVVKVLNTYNYKVILEKKGGPTCLTASKIHPGQLYERKLWERTPAQEKILGLLAKIPLPATVNSYNIAYVRKVERLRCELWLAYEEAKNPNVTLKGV